MLTGARQVGRSTLLLNAEPFRNWRFHMLDDFETLRQVYRRLEALWAGTQQVVIDEVQKAPERMPVIKRAVDRHPRQIQFALSGSANLLLMAWVSESLAGRAIYFVLDPMALGEINRSPRQTCWHGLWQVNGPQKGPSRRHRPTRYRSSCAASCRRCLCL